MFTDIDYIFLSHWSFTKRSVRDAQAVTNGPEPQTD